VRLGIIHLGRRGSGGPLTYEFARHLSELASVFVVLSERLEGLANWRRSELEYICVPTYTGLPGAARAVLDPSRLASISRQVRLKKPDVILYPMYYTLNSFLQHRLRDIPSVVFVHDAAPHPGLSNRLHGLLDTLSDRQATRCLLLSAALQPELCRRGVDPGRIDIVAHGPLAYYQRLSPSDQTNAFRLNRLSFCFSAGSLRTKVWRSCSKPSGS
jgi:hypothetical protein